VPTAEMKTDRLPVACLAPDLDEAKLAAYQALADALPDGMGEVRDAMRECLRAVKLWWELPQSSARPAHWKTTHKGKAAEFKVTPLTDELKKALYDAVPWPYELDAMQSLFDRTFADRARHPKPLADACYHLLWFARELCLDREPVTQSALPRE
jgi:hypothetical protein